jgi:hypothetical protein
MEDHTICRRYTCLWNRCFKTYFLTMPKHVLLAVWFQQLKSMMHDLVPGSIRMIAGHHLLYWSRDASWATVWLLVERWILRKEWSSLQLLECTLCLRSYFTREWFGFILYDLITQFKCCKQFYLMHVAFFANNSGCPRRMTGL